MRNIFGGGHDTFGLKKGFRPQEGAASFQAGKMGRCRAGVPPSAARGTYLRGALLRVFC